MDVLIKKLKFRSAHRGTRELDLLLKRFSDQFLDKMTREELEVYDAFLDKDDLDIYNILLGKIEPPENALKSYLSNFVII